MIASLGFVAIAGADPGYGYLPRIGPAPLRFRPVAAPVTNIFVLPPPLPEPVLEPLGPTNAPAMATAVSLPVDQGAVITEVSSAPPVEAPRQDEVVSPQMFLKFFNKSTNGNSTTVIAPLDFTPPKTSEPAGSRATSSTGQ